MVRETLEGKSIRSMEGLPGSSWSAGASGQEVSDATGVGPSASGDGGGSAELLTFQDRTRKGGARTDASEAGAGADAEAEVDAEVEAEAEADGNEQHGDGYEREGPSRAATGRRRSRTPQATAGGRRSVVGTPAKKQSTPQQREEATHQSRGTHQESESHDAAGTRIATPQVDSSPSRGMDAAYSVLGGGGSGGGGSGDGSLGPRPHSKPSSGGSAPSSPLRPAGLVHASPATTTATTTTTPPVGGEQAWTRKWTAVKFSGQAPSPRSGAASVVHNNKLYIFGGYGGGSGRMGDFHVFDFETFAWSRVEHEGDYTPGVRENNGVVAIKNCLYLYGGYNGFHWLTDLNEFNLDTRRWRRLGGSSSKNASKSPGPRFGFVSVAYRNSLIVWGGYDGTTWLNDGYQFDLDRMEWSPMRFQGDVPSIRSCPSWARYRDSVFVLGGYDGVARLADMFELRLDTNVWSQVRAQGTPPSPRYFHASVVFESSLFCFGGYTGGERLNDLHEYNLTTNRWRKINVPGDAPTGRSSLVAQVHGNSLYIYGGYNGQTVLNDFMELKLTPHIVPAPTLVNDLRSLINNEALSDVTFIVEGREVFAVSALLAVRSEHFRAMLFGGLRESTVVFPQHPAPAVGVAAGGVGGDSGGGGGVEGAGAGFAGASDAKTGALSASDADDDAHEADEVNEYRRDAVVVTQQSSTSSLWRREPIEMPDVSYETFVDMLEFLYTDNVVSLTEDRAVPLLIASERFLLDRLKGLCVDSIRTSISVDSVSHMLIVGHRHNCADLKEICFDFIIERFAEVKQSPTFRDLTAEPDLLLEVVLRSTNS